MKQNKFKVAYLKPYTEVVVINNETLLTETSFPGQHKPARRKTGSVLKLSCKSILLST